MIVTLVQAPEGAPNACFALIDSGTGETVQFVQSDWDYAGLASSLGWVPCECGRTDGTVDCEHRKVSEMLSEAFDYLSENDGKCFDWNGESGSPDNCCANCGAELDQDCNGNPRCDVCDGPCPRCSDGEGYPS